MMDYLDSTPIHSICDQSLYKTLCVEEDFWKGDEIGPSSMMKMFDMNLDEEPSIDLTPLIDTIFMLLIFFIMTTTFSRPVLDTEEAEVSGEHREQVISITPDVKQVKRSAPKPEVMPKSRSKPVLKSGKVSSAGKAIVVHKRAADVPGQPVICSGDAFSMPGLGGRRGGRG